MTSAPLPPPEYYHPTTFRVGRALSRAFEVLFSNFAAFVAISAVATAPLFAYQLAEIGRPRAVNTWVELLLQLTFSSLCEAMILYATFQALRGRPVRPGESIARGLQRFGPIVIASLLVGIITGLGLVLLVIPGLIATVMLVVTLPACVVEKLGPIESMQRSSQLTRGYRWPIFGAILVVAVVALIGTSVITTLLRGVGPIWLALAASFVFNALVEAYQTVLIAIIYHDLRVVKDGIDLENVAAVFD